VLRLQRTVFPRRSSCTPGRDDVAAAPSRIAPAAAATSAKSPAPVCCTAGAEARSISATYVAGRLIEPGKIGVLAPGARGDLTVQYDLPKISPASVVAQAYDSIEAGALEVLADAQTRQTKSAMGAEVEKFYPPIHEQFLCSRKGLIALLLMLTHRHTPTTTVLVRRRDHSSCPAVSPALPIPE
jgi:hypothetical protein